MGYLEVLMLEAVMARLEHQLQKAERKGGCLLRVVLARAGLLVLELSAREAVF